MEEFLARIERLEQAIATQIATDKEHGELLEELIEKNRKLIQSGQRESRMGLVAIATLSFFVLIVLMGLRVEMAGFTFGVPTEVVAGASGAIAGLVFYFNRDQ